MITQTTELEQAIRNIVARIIEIDSAKISRTSHFVNELGADSMMALEIMAALEKNFGITIPEEQINKIINLDEVIKLVNHLSSQKK